MPSPFPGMDPYLEADSLWPAFQRSLVNCLHQILIPGLVERYAAKLAGRHYRPEHSSFPAEVREEYIEIRQRSDGRLITLLDVVSPANKISAAGRTAYLDTRAQARNSNSNLVEIDVVLQGQPMLDYSRDGLPDWDYAVTVTRSTHPERYEIYTATLQKRLPRFRLPLADDDRDTVLDLHAATARAYEQGNFVARIDYRREPPTKIADEDRNWLGELLDWPVELRLSAREIADAAYFIWKEQGCPDGRADEHWQLAIERLKCAYEEKKAARRSDPSRA
jgi:hypothetical protein